MEDLFGMVSTSQMLGLETLQTDYSTESSVY